jgi:hypothetical protein
MQTSGESRRENAEARLRGHHGRINDEAMTQRGRFYQNWARSQVGHRRRNE